MLRSENEAVRAEVKLFLVYPELGALYARIIIGVHDLCDR